MQTKTYLVDQLRLHMVAAGLPGPTEEYRFAPPRRWRFDFCWPDVGLAVEVEGGTFAGGRHTRGTGYEADAEKYNAAAIRGFTVLRFTKHMVLDGRAIQTVQAFWETRGDREIVREAQL